MPDTILKRWNGTAFEELYPKTTVTQISASGTPSSSTFLRGDGQWATTGDVVGPASAVSANIATFNGTTGKLIQDSGVPSTNIIRGSTFAGAFNAPGGGTNTGVILYGDFYGWHTRSIGTTDQVLTVSSGVPVWATRPSGSGTSNQITYWSGTNTIAALSTSTYPSLTELSYVKGVTSAIQTQLNREITKYRATQQSSTSGNTNTTAVTSITLLANKYYHLDVTGMYSKTSTSGSTAPVITIAVNNTTGTPTINGRFEWLNGSAATAYTVSNTNGSITTTTNARGFTAATATLSAITTTPWGLKALFYTGTSDKILTFYIAHSSSVSGTCAVDNISIHATEVLA